MGFNSGFKGLMWIEENALSYICFMRAMNFLLAPYPVSNLKRYLWSILSNASVKSKERMHNGACDNSAYAIAFRIVASAPKIPRSDTPKC